MLSLAGIKNSLDEVRAQYYPKNETEKKVYENSLCSDNYTIMPPFEDNKYHWKRVA